MRSEARLASIPRDSPAPARPMPPTMNYSLSECPASPIAPPDSCASWRWRNRGRLLRTFRAQVEGRLTTAPQGSNGFGYDPLFFYQPFGCTFGEALLNRKMEVSHRSKALQAMREYLNQRSHALTYFMRRPA